MLTLCPRRASSLDRSTTWRCAPPSASSLITKSTLTIAPASRRAHPPLVPHLKGHQEPDPFAHARVSGAQPAHVFAHHPRVEQPLPREPAWLELLVHHVAQAARQPLRNRDRKPALRAINQRAR